MGTKLNLALNHSSTLPLYQQLAQQLKGSIASKALLPGEDLPSVRELSQQLNISSATVRRAIEQLEAEGWLAVTRGKRAIVSKSVSLQAQWVQSGSVTGSNDSHEIRTSILEFDENEDFSAKVQLSTWGQNVERLLDATNFYARYDEKVEIDFRAGSPPIDLLTGRRWQETLTRSMHHCLSVPREDYEPNGMASLRQYIVRSLHLERNIVCAPEDVFIVSGAQQARNLVSRLLIGPHTHIAFEEPGSIFARLMFQSFGAELVPVAVDESGLIVEELEQLNGISMLYLTPSAQFPTGAVLSNLRRRMIASWAERVNAIVIEDDNNCQFSYESRLSPSVFSYDTVGRTIYIGTFSQALVPSWRLGYLVVPPFLRGAMLRLKWLSDRCTSPIVQQLVWELFSSEFLSSHLNEAHRVCEERRLSIVRELESWPQHLATYTPVKGGLHQSVWFLSGIDDLEVFRDCFQEGVGVLPLSPHFLTKFARAGILLNFSAVTDKQIVEGMSRIKRVLLRLYGT